MFLSVFSVSSCYASVMNLMEHIREERIINYQAQFQELANTKGNFNKSVAIGLARQLSSQLSNTNFNLNGYGCWCYLDSNEGHGTPVNGFDELCRTLQKAYTCLNLEDATCEPWSDAVDYTMGAAPTIAEVQSNCDILNAGDSCAANTCKIDSWFWTSYSELLSSQTVALDIATYSHDSGFDTVTGCVAAAAGGTGGTGTAGTGGAGGVAVDVTTECCGLDYPIKYSFGYAADVRECCGDKTYNAALLECCDATTSRVAATC